MNGQLCRTLLGISLPGALVLLATATALAQSNPAGKMARITWDPPLGGTPVQRYTIQVVRLGYASGDTTSIENVTEKQISTRVQFGSTYKARVAAVDSLGRRGPFSAWSPPYSPEAVLGEDF